MQPKYRGLSLPFNRNPSTIMHLDLNSCFATIEQQANPHLRGKPLAVAAYTTPSGCILAPSVEAKRYGVKTGMRVKDGKMLCPALIVKEADPWKYRDVHLKLRNLLTDYTDQITPKSIDEFVLDLEGYPAFYRGLLKAAGEIKERIKREVGDWLTVSVGLSTNRFLAKTAAGLNKPDGLDEINALNFEAVYRSLTLPDLTGIAAKNSARLNSAGVHTVWQMFQAPLSQLKSAFQSIVGYYWYVRLRGYEIDDVDYGRRSYGNSYALPQPFSTLEELSPLMTKLVEKMSGRLRKAGYRARGVHLGLLYRDNGYWHRGEKTHRSLYESREIYREMVRLFNHCPYRKPVANLAVSVFNLESAKETQLDLFGEVFKGEKIAGAVDQINERWGEFVITPARMLSAKTAVPDRIAFGGIKELEEITLGAR